VFEPYTPGKFGSFQLGIGRIDLDLADFNDAAARLLIDLHSGRVKWRSPRKVAAPIGVKYMICKLGGGVCTIHLHDGPVARLSPLFDRSFSRANTHCLRLKLVGSFDPLLRRFLAERFTRARGQQPGRQNMPRSLQL
jgi:hypothetical protein